MSTQRLLKKYALSYFFSLYNFISYSNGKNFWNIISILKSIATQDKNLQSVKFKNQFLNNLFLNLRNIVIRKLLYCFYENIFSYLHNRKPNVSYKRNMSVQMLNVLILINFEIIKYLCFKLIYFSLLHIPKSS